MICSTCVGKSLQTYVFAHGGRGFCCYCNKEETKVMLVEELEDWILQAWDYLYANADESGSSAFDVLASYDISDLLENLDELELDDANPLFIEKLREDFDEKLWFPLGEGTIHGADEMFSNWENFCHIVKYKSRYFFLDYDISSYQFSTPRTTLESITELIQTQKIVTRIPPSIRIFRGRTFPTNTAISKLRASDLGSPRPEKAIKENRFNPAGISLFYGSFDIDTIKAEIGEDAKNLVIGEFHTSKEISVIDFTQLPDIPSLYADENRDISGITFLHSFADAISSPVDENKSIDYIPTQVFTEFIRKTFGQEIKGMKYKSAKCPEKANIVLFYENENCIDLENSSNDSDSLVLYSYRTD